MKSCKRRIIFITTIIFSFYINIGYTQSYGTNSIQGESDFRWPEGKKMGLSLSFDDARLTQTDNGIPLFDKYGVKATFYVIPDNMKKRLEAWKKAVINGHDIGNHSALHPCTINYYWSRKTALEYYTLPRMYAELDSANNIIQDVFGEAPVSFAYPCGQKFVGRETMTKSYVPLISAMFETGRGWRDEGPNNPAYCDMSQLTGMELDGKSFNEIKKLIESAKSKGSWLVLAGHEINDGGYQTSLLSTLDSLCKYAMDTSNGIWIDNIHNIASYINKIRGKITSNKLPVYLNPVFSIEKRVDDLLARMTLQEKIGQLNMPCIYDHHFGKDIGTKIDGCRKFSAGSLQTGIGPGGGLFSMRDILCPEGPRRQAELNNEFQKIAVEGTRLKIPLIMIDEATHGLQASGATIFPEGLSIGSTWNMGLVKDVYATIAREARATGSNHLCTLVIEPNRDPRMGRNSEGFSEDSYLCSHIAKAIVSGIQGDNIAAPDKAVAVLCHFPGQSQPVSGLENGEQEISDRTLREVFLPSWEKGIKIGGALGVMATYPAIDGVPTHASEKLLTSILRGELGFQGLVLSEGMGISNLIRNHVVASQKEAGALALKSGVDVGISYEVAYMESMIENVRDGKVNISLINRAVRRILNQKFRLGLFEEPYVDPNYAESTVHKKEHQELALKVAREGIVLLKNENKLLPLKKDIGSIVIIGPNADNARNQLGDYTASKIPDYQDIVTVLEGIKRKVSTKTKVTYVKGCDVMGDELNDIAKAKKAAKNADIAIVVVGENERYSLNGPTVGEGLDISTLELTGLQEDLVKAVYDSGTPTIVVLINGRPLSTRWIAEHVPAIIEPWFCGEKGGLAIADVLFGDYNPSGRLPITIPRNVGQLPCYYNYKYSKSIAIDRAYVDVSAKPLFEFGFGLSYTSFTYDNLVIAPLQIGAEGDILISLDVTNTGNLAGSEVVQLYINDVISSVTTPVKELKGFEKVKLNPGEKEKVVFTLKPEDISLLDQNLTRIVEPGTFLVMVGSSSNDIRLKGEFEVK